MAYSRGYLSAASPGAIIEFDTQNHGNLYKTFYSDGNPAPKCRGKVEGTVRIDGVPTSISSYGLGTPGTFGSGNNKGNCDKKWKKAQWAAGVRGLGNLLNARIAKSTVATQIVLLFLNRS